MVRINYELPDDLHMRAKAAAAFAGLTLKAFLIQALEEALEARPLPRPPRRRSGT